jgi:hypothetical protein
MIILLEKLIVFITENTKNEKLDTREQEKKVQID